MTWIDFFSRDNIFQFPSSFFFTAMSSADDDAPSVGPGSPSGVLANICGNERPSDVETSSNEATIVFRSDGNDQGKRGFVIRVNASIEGECEKVGRMTRSHGKRGETHICLGSFTYRG